MYRDIERNLLQWKNKQEYMPLLLRGARQVGKTFVIEKFGKEHFESVVTINFELHPEMIRCFDNLDPTSIISAIQPNLCECKEKCPFFLPCDRALF